MRGAISSQTLTKHPFRCFISEEVPGIIMPAELQLLTCAYYVVKKTLLTAEEVRAACKAIDDDGS